MFFTSKIKLIARIRELESRVTVAPNINNVIQPAQKEDNWHLIVSPDGFETWIRPNHISYISPITESNLSFGFSAIIDGHMISLSFKSKDAATEFRNILLNINVIPESNTYETKGEPWTILKEYETQIMNRKRVTQEDIDAMKMWNKMPDDIKYSSDFKKIKKYINKDANK